MSMGTVHQYITEEQRLERKPLFWLQEQNVESYVVGWGMHKCASLLEAQNTELLV